MSKPRGYIEKFLMLDAETSGFAYNEDDPSIDSKTGEEYQAVSWGLIVASAETLKPIEELYLEVKWNGVSQWSKGAEKIHGLSLAHLEKNGVESEQAALQIGQLILKHWGPDSPVHLGGHNVASFDLWFLRRQLRRHGLTMVKFGNKFIDTNPVGFTCLRTHNSDDLFEAVGIPARGAHNALEDARNALKSLRVIRSIYDKCISE